MIEKIRAFGEIVRPLNCLMGFGAVVIGALIGVGLDISFLFPVLLASLVAVFVTAGGNTMNDYFDREVDVIVHKKRPIPSRRLSPEEAIVFAVACFVVGVSLAIFINFLCLAIAVVNICLLVSYDKHFKKTGFAGNIIVSYLVGSIFLFAGAAVGNITTTGILATLAFLANLGREIIKDVEDIAGDRKERKTLPTRIGTKGSLFLAGLFIIAAVILSLFPSVYNILGIEYLIVVVIADIVFLYSVWISFENPHKAKNFVKIGMLLALISFLTGGIL